MNKSIDQLSNLCDQEVFAYSYNEYFEPLRNFIYYKSGSLTKAEDIAQESFSKAWENCSSVILEKAKSYLYTVAHRIFLNQVKHDKVVLNFEKQSLPEHKSETPEFELIGKEFKQSLNWPFRTYRRFNEKFF